MHRLRIRFRRGEEVKFISHLDITRLWERALRRARIPLAHSEGFNPRPRISLAAPLSVGVTGEAELMDIFIDRKVSPHWLTASVIQQLPSGIEILDVYQIAPNMPSLQSQIRYAQYEVEIGAEKGSKDIETAVSRLLSAEHLPWYHERDTGRRFQYSVSKNAMVYAVTVLVLNGIKCFSLIVVLNMDILGTPRIPGCVGRVIHLNLRNIGVAGAAVRIS